MGLYQASSSQSKAANWRVRVGWLSSHHIIFNNIGTGFGKICQVKITHNVISHRGYPSMLPIVLWWILQILLCRPKKKQKEYNNKKNIRLAKTKIFREKSNNQSIVNARYSHQKLWIPMKRIWTGLLVERTACKSWWNPETNEKNKIVLLFNDMNLLIMVG